MTDTAQQPDDLQPRRQIGPLHQPRHLHAAHVELVRRGRKMRLRRTLRNEHAGGDFGVRIALGRQHHGLALAVGQRVEQGARLIAARTRPRDAQIVDQLFLTGRVELRRASHTR